MMGRGGRLFILPGLCFGKRRLILVERSVRCIKSYLGAGGGTGRYLCTHKFREVTMDG